MIWKIWKISVLVIITPKETSSTTTTSYSPSSSSSTNWYFKRCGLKKYGEKHGKIKCFIASCTRKASNVALQPLRFEKLREKKYGKMKCFIRSCTRKASNVAFQTLRFEKVREKSMGKCFITSGARHENKTAGKFFDRKWRYPLGFQISLIGYSRACAQYCDFLHRGLG